MNKYRIKFSKIGSVKFVGHLDLLKIFQRAIRRAEIPISYSQGFNPHPIMSFCIPLPLGMESESEYLDIKLNQQMTEGDILKKLNEQMPIGLEITKVLKLKDDEKNSSSVVSTGGYEVLLDREISIQDFNKKIEELLNSNEIIIEKKTKKRGKEIFKNINIKDEIYQIKAIDKNKLYLFIATGSSKNLKPDVLMEYIYNYFGFDYQKFRLHFKRTSLERTDGEKFIPLDELDYTQK